MTRNLGLSDLNEVGGRKRTKGQRGQRSAHIERAEVDRKVAGLFDYLANLGLRVGVVPRIEQDTLAPRYCRLRQEVGVEMVECFDNACARNEFADHLAGMLAA
jgi:hypothetical protein